MGRDKRGWSGGGRSPAPKVRARAGRALGRGVEALFYPAPRRECVAHARRDSARRTGTSPWRVAMAPPVAGSYVRAVPSLRSRPTVPSTAARPLLVALSLAAP